jgi:ribose transport system substrate-binding protein
MISTALSQNAKLAHIRKSLARRIAFVVASAAILAIAACASSSSAPSDPGSSTGAGSSSSPSATAASIVAQAQSALDPYYKIRVWPVPTTGPAAAAKKRIWIVSCGQQSPGCADGVADAETAAKAIGWSVSIYDGNFDTNNAYTTGIQQAIAAQANGVLLYGIPCDSVTQAVANAKRAHIVVLSTESCSGGYGLEYAPGYEGNPQFFYLSGQLAAWKVIEATDGKANVLFYNIVAEEDSVSEWAGFQNVMSRCQTCTVKEENVPLSQLSPALSAQVQSDLQANPGVNTIAVPYASVYDIGIGAGLARVNRKIFVMSGQQSTSLYTAIHNTSSNVTLATVTSTSPGQSSWAAIDAMNRAFNGSPMIPEGAFLGITDSTHNLPPSGQGFDGPGEQQFFTTSFPYQDTYEKIWKGNG